jgi:hypothetical protein
LSDLFLRRKDMAGRKELFLVQTYEKTVFAKGKRFLMMPEIWNLTRSKADSLMKAAPI